MNANGHAIDRNGTRETGDSSNVSRNSADILGHPSTSSLASLNSMKHHDLLARRKNAANEHRFSMPNAQLDNVYGSERGSNSTEEINAMQSNDLLQVR